MKVLCDRASLCLQDYCAGVALSLGHALLVIIVTMSMRNKHEVN